MKNETVDEQLEKNILKEEIQEDEKPEFVSGGW